MGGWGKILIVNDPADLHVLGYDETILVVAKPAGLLTIADGYNAALPHVRTYLEAEWGPLWIVHRLDRETSGVLLLARSAESHRRLNTQFEQGAVYKEYHAITRGTPDWNRHTSKAPLKSNVGRKKRTIVDAQGGKPAVTDFEVLRRYTKNCLLLARPHTGRTHQIRAHLYALGLPILGDKLYGETEVKEAAVTISRLALHAERIGFNHPFLGKPVTYSAAYPLDFAETISRLEEGTPFIEGELI